MSVFRKIALFVCAGLPLTIAGCSSTSVAPTAKPSWERVLPPQISETDEVRVDGTDLEDGVYWANVAPVSGDDAIVFSVTRVRFGQTCERWAAAMLREDACLNDYEVEEYPEAFATISPYARVSVSMPGAPGENLLVDAATLRHLARKDLLVLPAGYEWIPFPFVVSVESGVIVEAYQYWVP